MRIQTILKELRLFLEKMSKKTTYLVTAQTFAEFHQKLATLRKEYSSHREVLDEFQSALTDAFEALKPILEDY